MCQKAGCPRERQFITRRKRASVKVGEPTLHVGMYLGAWHLDYVMDDTFYSARAALR